MEASAAAHPWCWCDRPYRSLHLNGGLRDLAGVLGRTTF